MRVSWNGGESYLHIVSKILTKFDAYSTTSLYLSKIICTYMCAKKWIPQSKLVRQQHAWYPILVESFKIHKNDLLFIFIHQIEHEYLLCVNI